MLKIHALSSSEGTAQAIIDAMQDARLSFRARGVLGMLLSHAGETWDVGTLDSFAIEISKRQAAAAGRVASGEGQQSLRTILKELEAAGYITRRPMGNGVYRGSCVEVYCTPGGGESSTAPLDLGEGCVVYVISEIGTSIAKIGTTRNLRKRLQVLQSNHRNKLEIAWQTAGGWGLEQYLHDHFVDKRLTGEWFDFGSEDPADVVRHAVADYLASCAA